MNELIESLQETLMQAFDQGTTTNNNTALTFIFKLFPLIGRKELGLDKLAAYLCTSISQTISQTLKKAIESSIPDFTLWLIFVENKSMYLDCLVLLFESVASMIDKQEQMVEFYYGVGSMLIIIQRYFLMLTFSLIF